jgi:hypothetical protein
MSVDEPLQAGADESPEQFAARLFALRDRLAPSLPDMDPGDLLLILQSLLRPPGSGKSYFLRPIRPGVYVF